MVVALSYPRVCICPCAYLRVCVCICLFLPRTALPCPAASVSKVQEVVDRLRISNIQHRCEDDADVHRYLHGREEEVRKVMLQPLAMADVCTTS